MEDSCDSDETLYLSGKQKAGIFIGLWPPTFQALKAVVDKGEGPA